MKEFLKTHRVLFALVALYTAIAGAATLKTWTSGEAITAQQLNDNFSIVNSRSLAAKSAAASAVATATNGPQAAKAFGVVHTATTVCSASPCTVANGYNVTSVTRTSAGVYVITFPSARANPKPMLLTTLVKNRPCYQNPTWSGSTTTETIDCFVDATAAAAAADSSFVFTLLEP